MMDCLFYPPLDKFSMVQASISFNILH